MDVYPYRFCACVLYVSDLVCSYVLFMFCISFFCYAEKFGVWSLVVGPGPLHNSPVMQMMLSQCVFSVYTLPRSGLVAVHILEDFLIEPQPVCLCVFHTHQLFGFVMAMIASSPLPESCALTRYEIHVDQVLQTLEHAIYIHSAITYI